MRLFSLIDYSLNVSNILYTYRAPIVTIELRSSSRASMELEEGLKEFFIIKKAKLHSYMGCPSSSIGLHVALLTGQSHQYWGRRFDPRLRQVGKLASDLWCIGGFLRVLRFPPPIRLDSRDITQRVLKKRRYTMNK